MPSLHSIRAALVALALTVVPGVSAQPPVPPPLPDPGATSFTIFLRGVPIGSEQVALARSGDGWTITSTGRLGAPIDALARRMVVRYTAEWKPLEFSLDATVKGAPQTVRTIVEGTIAKSDVV